MFPANEDNNFNDTNMGNEAPSNDALFESFLNDGLDDLSDTEKNDIREARSEDVLAAGLHFFEKMKGA